MLEAAPAPHVRYRCEVAARDWQVAKHLLNGQCRDGILCLVLSGSPFTVPIAEAAVGQSCVCPDSPVPPSC